MDITTSVLSNSFSIKAANTSHRVLLTIYPDGHIDITPPEGGNFNFLNMTLPEMKIVSELIHEAVEMATVRINAN